MVSQFDSSHSSSIDADIITALLDQAARRTPPRATYRIQFHAGFTFRDAIRIVPYLARLGVSHLYASPVFKANPGSTHGYDVTDFAQINPEIGTRDEFDKLVAVLRDRGLGLIFDFVPNHMGVSSGRNRWWQDVLENGRASPYAAWFDIDWSPLKTELGNKVLLPILGDQYGAVLENGELVLRFEDGAFTIWYHEVPLPVAPPSYGTILRESLPAIDEALPEEALPAMEFKSLIASLDRLTGQDETDPGLVAERLRDQVVAKARLAGLVDGSPEIRNAVEAAVTALNGTVEDPDSFDELDELLNAQSYRLAFWRVAGEEINYRRFFAINELAAIRQELPDVFSASHELLLDLVAEGSIDGVRIDHPDGLWDPAGYFRRLQRAAFIATYRRAWLRGAGEGLSAEEWPTIEAAVGAWWDAEWDIGSDRRRLMPLYLVIEKILSEGEQLPADWAVDGTVGYEFASDINALFVDPKGRDPMSALYSRFTGRTTPYAVLARDEKKMIMRTAFASEVAVLARALDRLTEFQRRTRDFTLNSLRDAMREVIASFPVYRTYVAPDTDTVDDRDRRIIERAVRDAQRLNPDIDASVFAFVRGALLLETVSPGTDELDKQRESFALKFQQLTGPVMAKAVEDSVFYIYNRLTSLNEVGGEPLRFGVATEEAHRRLAERSRRWPSAMLTSSTHDTKRSEDVRARISALSGMPREWQAAVNRWARLNRSRRTRVEGAAAPDRNDEYLLYQTLIGAWPIGMREPDHAFRARILAYMEKAIREAQVHTSWTNQNQTYEQAVSAFVHAILDPKSGGPFLADFATFQERISRAGLFTALSQQVLKLTAPGVPDIYQGTETWDFSLVDPDNRRPVDYDARIGLLRSVVGRKTSSRLARDLLQSPDDGRIKLFATATLLAHRAACPELYANGSYAPLDALGDRAEHVFAFARSYDQHEILIIVPRLAASLLNTVAPAPIGSAVWGNTIVALSESAAGASYRNLFTSERTPVDYQSGTAAVSVGQALASFPVCALVREL